MTRNFNNQRRENERPYSRRPSPGRSGEERSPRSARPRLSRDMVDRGWEHGARQNHADYRASSTNNGQPSRDNWKRNQSSYQPSAQNSRNNRKPYGNRQDSYRQSGPTSRSNGRTRSYESSMRNFDEQRYNEYRGYSDRPGGAGHRPGYRENAGRPDSRSQYREQGQNRGYPQRDNQQSHSTDRGNRQFRSADSENRPYRNGPQRDTHNPRRQSRSPQRGGNFSRRPGEYRQPRSEQELFEGDYERFDASNADRHPGSQYQDSPDTPAQVERHTTRLPGGRVLKGPRDAQRRDAEFWTDIAHESDELLKPIEAATTMEEDTPHSMDNPSDSPAGEKPKPRTRNASAATRGSKSNAKQRVPKSRSNGPRPSQRGYKWPTP